MYLILARVFQKYSYKWIINDGGKKYLYKLTTSDSSLVGEEINIYTKFTHTIKLNNI